MSVLPGMIRTMVASPRVHLANPEKNAQEMCIRDRIFPCFCAQDHESHRALPFPHKGLQLPFPGSGTNHAHQRIRMFPLSVLLRAA